MKAVSELKPYIIGLGLGGANSVSGIADGRDDIKATTSIKMQEYENIDDYVDASIEALQLITDQAGGVDKTKTMGTGASNGNFYNGTIEFAPSLSWGHDGIVPLAKLFSDKLGIPVTLINSANVAAIGETTYGVTRDMKNSIVITLGAGVGSGIVVNGQLVYGSDGFVGEPGHIVVRCESGRLCSYGRFNYLEACRPATGAVRTTYELLETTEEPSVLRSMIPEDITSLDVSIVAGKSDKLLQYVYQMTDEMLSEACANFTVFSFPETSTFFGGLIEVGGSLIRPLKESYDRHVLKTFKDKAKFLVSRLNGSSVAVLGTSAAGWEI